MQTVSVIIPALNEEQLVGRLIRHLKTHGGSSLKEVILVDGNSQDRTAQLAEQAGATVITCQKCGRAHQMNVGAKIASGDILFFVHCDTLPPSSYLTDVINAVQQGHKIGCYRAKYQSDNWLLKINSYCTRFQKLWCRGGDQTLFITRAFFEEIGAYREECKIMEEYELIRKAQTYTTFFIIPKEVIISTRKYENRNYFRIQMASLIAFFLFNRKASDERIVAVYNKLLGSR